MSRSRLVAMIALASLVLTPLPSMAQGAPQTHTVKKGDTLWDIAKQYLGDPFKWPEIYRRNTSTIADPDLIYPDQVVIISGEVAATPGTPADAGVPVAPTMGEEPQRPAGPAPTMTIFNPERFKVVRGERASLEMMGRPTAVRRGDYQSAPFLWDAAGITGAGKVGTAVQSSTVAKTRYETAIQLYERVYVTVPSNATGAVNEVFVSFRYGPTLDGEGQVVVPTGMLRLLTVPQNGQAEALLLNKFEDVYAGHGLIPMDSLAMPAGVMPVRVEFGLATKVLWLDGDPLVPSIGQHMVLAAGATEGLVPGDQVTLQVELGPDEKGVPRAPRDVAVVQVTRVTNWGASAVLIGQNEGVVTPGMAARVTAKMP
jgi:hypothetical protein